VGSDPCLSYLEQQENEHAIAMAFPAVVDRDTSFKQVEDLGRKKIGLTVNALFSIFKDL